MSDNVQLTRQWSYRDAAPLDWFQLRAFLWEALARFPAGLSNRWSQVATYVNGRCESSVPQPDHAYRDVYERLASAQPALRNASGPADVGYEVWTRMLYGTAQSIFNMTPIFMNLGFAPLNPDEPLNELWEEDEPYRLFIKLYQRVVGTVNLKGRKVLEVGCGSGGGCSYIMRYLGPSSVSGIDLVEENIKSCRKRHSLPGITFALGDANALRFADNSFDVVVNIESSHSYPSMQQFFSEVYRVLRPQGYFLFADLRPTRDEWGHDRTVAGLHAQLEQSGLKMLRKADITSNILRSMDLQKELKTMMLTADGIEEADIIHFNEIMFCQGSRNYEKLKNRDIQYWTFTCQK